MTSKEALEYLTSKVFTGGNSILETEANICKEIILKDLERLEEIKNDNILLKVEIEDSKYIEIANLKHSIDEKNEIIGDLTQENEKLKKAIDILKDKVKITVKTPYVWLETHDNCVYFKVTQQEYDLLKEVLGE